MKRTDRVALVMKLLIELDSISNHTKKIEAGVNRLVDVARSDHPRHKEYLDHMKMLEEAYCRQSVIRQKIRVMFNL